MLPRPNALRRPLGRCARRPAFGDRTVYSQGVVRRIRGRLDLRRRRWLNAPCLPIGAALSHPKHLQLSDSASDNEHPLAASREAPRACYQRDESASGDPQPARAKGKWLLSLGWREPAIANLLASATCDRARTDRLRWFC